MNHIEASESIHFIFNILGKLAWLEVKRNPEKTPNCQCKTPNQNHPKVQLQSKRNFFSSLSIIKFQKKKKKLNRRLENQQKKIKKERQKNNKIKISLSSQLTVDTYFMRWNSLVCFIRWTGFFIFIFCEWIREFEFIIHFGNGFFCVDRHGSDLGMDGGLFRDFAKTLIDDYFVAKMTNSRTSQDTKKFPKNFHPFLTSWHGSCLGRMSRWFYSDLDQYSRL